MMLLPTIVALFCAAQGYFAISPNTGDVYYFGEDVDMYTKGQIVNHEGSWRHGTNGATFGLMMPGKPATGMKFYSHQFVR